MQIAILHIAHLIGITAAQHLLHKPIIVAGVVVRMSLFEESGRTPPTSLALELWGSQLDFIQFPQFEAK